MADVLQFRSYQEHRVRKSVFLRGIRSIPYDKQFWLDGIAWNEGFSPSERANWIEMMKKKGVIAETDLCEAKLISGKI